MKSNAVAQRLELRETCRSSHIRAIPVLAEAPMKRVYTPWRSMADDQLVEEGNCQIKEKGVTSKSKLKDSISGLFRAINRRENAAEIWARINFCEEEKPANRKKPEISIPETPLIEEHNTEVESSETPLEQPKVPVAPSQIYGSWKSKASDTIIRIANDFIQKAEIGNLGELKAADKSLWAIIRKRKIYRSLEFVEKEKMTEPKSEKKRESRPPKEKEMPDVEKMYGYILHECFRMGTGKAYIGHHRGTIQQLKSGIEFTKQEWRVFKRCWRTMVRAGIITYNSTETAASLDIKRNHIEDPAISRVVHEAIEEESKLKTSR